MAKILKPRRGTAATMNGPKANTVLAAGEIFFEIPNSGLGSAQNGKIKMGDGVTAYGSLPYFLEPTDLQNEEITVTADVSSTSSAALGNVTSNKNVGTLIGSLKQAISLVKSETTTEINKLGTSSSDKLQFPIVKNNGVYGYKNADGIFQPFRADSTETYTFSSGSGGTVELPGGVRNNYRYVNAENVYSSGYSAGKSDGTTTHTETYRVTTRQSDINMGENHAYRYIDSTGVPNYNDETYVFEKNEATIKTFDTDNRIRTVNCSAIFDKGKNAAYERTMLWELTSLPQSGNYGEFKRQNITLLDDIINQQRRPVGKYRRTQVSNGKTTDYEIGTLLKYDILEVYVSIGDATTAAEHLSRIEKIKNMFSFGVENMHVPGIKNSLTGEELISGNSYAGFCHVNYIDARRLSGLNYDGTSNNSFDTGSGGRIDGNNPKVGLQPEVLHAGGFNSANDYSLSVYCRILGKDPSSNRILKVGNCTSVRSTTVQNRNCIPYLIYGVKFKYYRGDEKEVWSRYKNDSNTYTYTLL